jgi:hypothetical protein
MLDNIANWGISKFFASLIDPKILGNNLDRVMKLYKSNTLGQAANRLFTWVIIIIVLSIIIDQIFYWIRPEQRYRALKFLSHIRKFKRMIFDKNRQRTGR